MTYPDTTPGTLAPTDPHPAAEDARQWLLGYVRRHDADELPRLLESFSSVGMSGNRLAEVCAETLRRFMNGEPVGDRYALGLIWTIRSMERDTLQRQIAKASKALRWYAEPFNYRQCKLNDSHPIMEERFYRARDALKALNEDSEQ